MAVNNHPEYSGVSVRPTLPAPWKIPSTVPRSVGDTAVVTIVEAGALKIANPAAMQKPPTTIVALDPETAMNICPTPNSTSPAITDENTPKRALTRPTAKACTRVDIKPMNVNM